MLLLLNWLCFAYLSGQNFSFYVTPCIKKLYATEGLKGRRWFRVRVEAWSKWILFEWYFFLFREILELPDYKDFLEIKWVQSTFQFQKKKNENKNDVIVDLAIFPVGVRWTNWWTRRRRKTWPSSEYQLLQTNLKSAVDKSIQSYKWKEPAGMDHDILWLVCHSTHNGYSKQWPQKI